MGASSSVDNRSLTSTSTRRSSMASIDRLRTPVPAVFDKISDRCYPFRVQFDMIESVMQGLNKFRTARTSDIYPALEFLESFTSANSHGKEVAERWTNKLDRNGWIGIAMRLWPSFWKPDFIKQLCQLKRDQEVPRDLEVVAENFVIFCAIFLNGSDASKQFCYSLINQGVIEELVMIVSKKEFDPENAVKVGLMELDYIVHCAAGIIHNGMKYYPVETKQRFRAADGINVFQRLLKSENAMVCTSAAFSLAYGINENELDVIKTQNDIIVFIINKILGPCFENKNRRAHGFSIQETMEALNALAANDTNNVKIVGNGGLKWYQKCIERPGSDGELMAASQGFWIFSFKQDNVREIRRTEGCVQALEKLKVHKNWMAARAAKGALWNISGKAPTKLRARRAGSADSKKETKEDKPSSAGSKHQQHVMISYDHLHKDIVKELNAKLKQAGYHTWFDEDKMKGNTLEAMAEAIEDAAVVLVCTSDRYKHSPSCRTEAEYAYRLQKVIIPIRTEQSYMADGWLGALMGTKLYFDCYRMDQVQDCCDKVVNELGNRGKLGASGAPVKSKPTKSHEPSHVSRPGFENWTNQKVRWWLQDIGLAHIVGKFGDMDGSLLAELKSMYQKSPTVFYQKAEHGLGLTSLPDLLKFTKNLDKLD